MTPTDTPFSANTERVSFWFVHLIFVLFGTLRPKIYWLGTQRGVHPSQSQSSNQFFVFRQPENWLSARNSGSRVAPTLCWSRRKSRFRKDVTLWKDPVGGKANEFSKGFQIEPTFEAALAAAQLFHWVLILFGKWWMSSIVC